MYVLRLCVCVFVIFVCEAPLWLFSDVSQVSTTVVFIDRSTRKAWHSSACVRMCCFGAV